jgi:tetratricopeptide (TPR) repeat protein
MQMFLQNQIAPDSPLKENVYRNFQKNLDDIVRAGTGSGAKVLLNTVAVNLKDCPPFASLTNKTLPVADLAQFEEIYSAGCTAEAQTNFAEAAQKFERAAKLDPQFPDLQFRWGESLLAQNQAAEAQKHFQLACDDDALPFRADSRINAAIRDEPKKINSDKLILFDAAAALTAAEPEQMCGQETFYEHVHFDFDGSYRLARAWAEQIEPLLPKNPHAWASQNTCEEMLGLSDWNRALVIEHMLGRMQQPPFSGQPNNAFRMERLQARANQLHQQMNAAGAKRERENFLKQLERAPDDFDLRANFALFLQSIGDLPQATLEWRRVQEMLPQDFLTYFQLGHLLAIQGQPADAEASLRRALALRPSLTEGWVELGNALALQEKYEAALVSYATALKQRPQDGQTMFRCGQVLAKLNRHAEAMDKYRAAIQLNPADWESHFELGGELDAAGQLDAARSEFGEAARLNPNRAQTHLNYGVLLAKQNRIDAAQHEFEEALRLEPTYKKAQEYLAQIQLLKKRTP